jgi:hypothetical protein
MEGLFSTVSGWTTVLCGVGGFAVIMWIMSYGHGKSDKH